LPEAANQVRHGINGSECKDITSVTDGNICLFPWENHVEQTSEFPEIFKIKVDFQQDLAADCDPTCLIPMAGFPSKVIL
jgi:uncharacterized protein involved in tolerance to divalent cations